MEGPFAKLVDQFISGRLSRRDLIQGIAAVAAVSGPSAFAATPNADRRETKVIGINHISYQSKDYGKARDFYSKNFGMKVSHDDGKQAYLEFAQTVLMVRQSKGPTPLIDHIAYTISDYGNDSTSLADFKANHERVRAEFAARGLEPTEGAGITWGVHDPDGLHVQICPELNKPGNPLFEKAIGNVKR